MKYDGHVSYVLSLGCRPRAAAPQTLDAARASETIRQWLAARDHRLEGPAGAWGAAPRDMKNCVCSFVDVYAVYVCVYRYM